MFSLENMVTKDEEDEITKAEFQFRGRKDHIGICHKQN